MTAVADVAVALVVAAGLVGSGLTAPGALALAAGIRLSVLVRGVGDVLQEHGSALSWFSTLAWAQQTRAFVDLRWWPLLLPVALIAALVAAATTLTARRDLGAGLVATRRGPARALPLLSGPAGCWPGCSAAASSAGPSAWCPWASPSARSRTRSSRWWPATADWPTPSPPAAERA